MKQGSVRDPTGGDEQSRQMTKNPLQSSDSALKRNLFASEISPIVGAVESWVVGGQGSRRIPAKFVVWEVKEVPVTWKG